jgi:hypothetical protein
MKTYFNQTGCGEQQNSCGSKSRYHPVPKECCQPASPRLMHFSTHR